MSDLTNSTVSPDNHTEFPQINYLEDYTAIYLPYLIFNVGGFILGTSGNLVVILTIGLDKHLNKNPAYLLMLNLALSDINISIFVQTFTNIGIILGESFFHYRLSFCIFLGALCLVACATSLFNLAFLAINRYINICHNNLYKKVFTRNSTIGFCVLAWICGMFIDTPNFLGWGGHFFDKKSANCMWNRLANKSYSIFFPTTAIFIPCVGILCFYIRIFMYAYKSKNKLKENQSLRKSLVIAKSLFLSFALFTICWVPYGMLIAFGYDDHVSMTFHALFTFMAHINSTANPIFYILLNPAFKKSFKSLKGRLFGINVSISGTNNTNHTNKNNNNNSSFKEGHSVSMRRMDRSKSFDNGSSVGQTNETNTTFDLKPNNKVYAVE